MKTVCERHEDLELKALYDEGMDVSWAGEKITFTEDHDDRAFVFRLDDSMPGEAILSAIIEDGRSRAVKLGEAFASNEIELPRTDATLVQALEFLRDKRQMRLVAIYDGLRGFYARVPISEIIST